jgi:hypothetical protein
MTAPVLTFVLTRRRKQKTRLVGRVVVAAIRRALTHHSLNGANNQRNREKAAVHLTKHDLAKGSLSIARVLAGALNYKLRSIYYNPSVELECLREQAGKVRLSPHPAASFRETF